MDAHLSRQLVLLEPARLAQLLIFREPVVVYFVHGLRRPGLRWREELRRAQVLDDLAAAERRIVAGRPISEPVGIHFIDRSPRRPGLHRRHPARRAGIPRLIELTERRRRIALLAGGAARQLLVEGVERVAKGVEVILAPGGVSRRPGVVVRRLAAQLVPCRDRARHLR